MNCSSKTARSFQKYGTGKKLNAPRHEYGASIPITRTSKPKTNDFLTLQSYNLIKSVSDLDITGGPAWRDIHRECWDWVRDVFFSVADEMDIEVEEENLILLPYYPSIAFYVGNFFDSDIWRVGLAPKQDLERDKFFQESLFDGWTFSENARLHFILAHELRHRFQYSSGMMVNTQDDGGFGVVFKGEKFLPWNVMGMDHLEKPWEKDANEVAFQVVQSLGLIVERPPPPSFLNRILGFNFW